MDNKPSTSGHAAVAVAEAMEQVGMSRLALAEASGIPAATLYRRLRGYAPGFTLDELGRIADALGVDMLRFIPARGAA